ncbi:MAG: VOC family protein [Sulfitobacter litoralis]|jgi:hypothetical protein|uniref:Glyoxalase-like domain-containing protein n=2 Tax=root TaxID=1 RepID=A0A1H0QZX6_9RHOB|nr:MULTISPECIES: VOC family protein [Sulfitobacter]MBQ0717957.1 VOC family protein [Sulfitobacter litoralis]MBQ0765807.1 VOC family protein [Sulfitobacter litoralis]MBQ0802068.1 VOC family protein [Sulfitobacter litoralis]MCF7726471.1 VOC family protein [Sulfitobacter sp. M22]MCF7777813.1 VOC family protein [Sulfitobacter sp. M220]|tara:strand:+ start:81 stop:695 length:615 start_codon:yes stop_codon:yes gene_type:complete
MIELDHLAVAGESLEAASDYAAQVLGVPLQSGGAHAVFGTHNHLLGLSDALYLEAIAVDPDAPQPAYARWFDLDRFNGPARLSNWICRCDDLAAALDALPEGYGAPVQLQRGDLSWRMAVPENGVLPYDNCAPALMQWDGDAHPTQRLDNSGCRLVTFMVQHPQAEALAAALAPLLKDARVMFEVGTPGLFATFDTPAGRGVLA